MKAKTKSAVLRGRERGGRGGRGAGTAGRGGKIKVNAPKKRKNSSDGESSGDGDWKP